MFTIQNVSRISFDLVQVTVSIPAKEWHTIKRRGALGALYGIDISNAAYRLHGIKAYQPGVNDRVRASNGIKTITLTYVDAVWAPMPDNLVIIAEYVAGWAA